MSLSTNPFITIDHGNTHSKLLIHKSNISEEITLDQYLKNEDYHKLPGIISHVGKKEMGFPEHLISLRSIFEDGQFLDMPVQYEQTLGEDRLINAYYSYRELLNNKKTLIIDAGTFVTLDIVSPEKDSKGFLGGYIIPGESTYLKSFSSGNDLPVFEKAELENHSNLPKSTKEAIQYSFELILKSSIEKLITEQKIDKIIITGGSGPLIKDMLQDEMERREISLSYIKNLVHLSLAYLYKQLQGMDFQ